MKGLLWKPTWLSSKLRAFARKRRATQCWRRHKAFWELLSHGHRKCSQCGIEWKRGQRGKRGGVTSADRAIMPQEVKRG